MASRNLSSQGYPWSVDFDGPIPNTLDGVNHSLNRYDDLSLQPYFGLGSSVFCSGSSRIQLPDPYALLTLERSTDQQTNRTSTMSEDRISCPPEMTSNPEDANIQVVKTLKSSNRTRRSSKLQTPRYIQIIF